MEPAARGATALLGERPEVPTLVALGLGPGCGEKTGEGMRGEGVKGKGVRGEGARDGGCPRWPRPPHHDGGGAAEALSAAPPAARAAEPRPLPAARG